MLKLSVLVVFYNQAQYVDQALKSVLMQKVNFDYEILIGDDGSDDGTMEKLETWRNHYPDRIKIFQQPREPEMRPPSPLQARRRGSLNRLRLLKEARGQYFALFDGDDYYTNENKLQWQIDILDDPGNYDCAACAHAVDKIWPDGSVKHMNNPAMKEQKFIPERLWAVVFFSSCGIIFRNHFKDFLPEELFLRFNLTETHLSAWLLRFGGYYYLPEVMSCYRQHPNSNTNRLTDLEINLGGLYIFDFERLILPDLWETRAFRYRHILKAAYQARLHLADPAYDPFRLEAERQKSAVALLFLNYTRLRFKDKLRLHWLYFSQKMLAVWFRLSHRDYFKPGGGKSWPQKKRNPISN